MHLSHQRFDGAGFSVGECLLVNERSPAPVFLVHDVHCGRIVLLKKGGKILTREYTSVVLKTDVINPELNCSVI